MSNINVFTSARNKGVVVDVKYEIPVPAVTEAIVNAVAHRDYTSNASVQVMLFKDRLEVWNPGHLPYGMTVEKLKQKHSSIPINPLIAEPLYLAGTIERMGTGTGDIIRQCKKAGLKSPEFVEEEDFRVILWRSKVKSKQVVEKAPTKRPPSTHQVPSMHHTSTHQAPTKRLPSARQVPTKRQRSVNQVPNRYLSSIIRLLSVINGEMTRQEIQSLLSLTDKVNLRSLYLQPAIEKGLIAMKFSENPNHPKQSYYLTSKGMKIKRKKMLKRKISRRRHEII